MQQIRFISIVRRRPSVPKISAPAPLISKINFSYNMPPQHGSRARMTLGNEARWTFRVLKVPHCAFIVVHVFVSGANAQCVKF